MNQFTNKINLHTYLGSYDCLQQFTRRVKFQFLGLLYEHLVFYITLNNLTYFWSFVYLASVFFIISLFFILFYTCVLSAQLSLLTVQLLCTICIYSSMIFELIPFALFSDNNFDVVNLILFFGFTYNQCKDKIKNFIKNDGLIHFMIGYTIFDIVFFKSFSLFFKVEFYLVTLCCLILLSIFYLVYFFMYQLYRPAIILFSEQQFPKVYNVLLSKRGYSTLSNNSTLNNLFSWVNWEAVWSLRYLFTLLIINFIFTLLTCDVSKLIIKPTNVATNNWIETYGGLPFWGILFLIVSILLACIAKYLSITQSKYKILFLTLHILFVVCFSGGNMAFFSSLHSFNGIDAEGHFTTVVSKGNFFAVEYVLLPQIIFDNKVIFEINNLHSDKAALMLQIDNKIQIIRLLKLGQFKQAEEFINNLTNIPTQVKVKTILEQSLDWIIANPGICISVTLGVILAICGFSYSPNRPIINVQSPTVDVRDSTGSVDLLTIKRLERQLYRLKADMEAKQHVDPIEFKTLQDEYTVLQQATILLNEAVQELSNNTDAAIQQLSNNTDAALKELNNNIGDSLQELSNNTGDSLLQLNKNTDEALHELQIKNVKLQADIKCYSNNAVNVRINVVEVEQRLNQLEGKVTLLEKDVTAILVDNIMTS